MKHRVKEEDMENAAKELASKVEEKYMKLRDVRNMNVTFNWTIIINALLFRD